MRKYVTIYATLSLTRNKTQRPYCIAGTCSRTSAMTSMMIALLLALCAMPVQGTTEMSTNIANLLAVFNGYFDNEAQFLADPVSHDYVQMKVAAVIIPAFPGQIVLYTEWAFKGFILNLRLAVLSERSNGVIYLTLHDIPHTSGLKANVYKLEELSKLKAEDYEKPSTCEAVLEAAAPGVFTGSWCDCGHDSNGKHALYGITIECNKTQVLVPRVASEQNSDMPYNLVIRSEKYAVPNLPAGFVSPCK